MNKKQTKKPLPKKENIKPNKNAKKSKIEKKPGKNYPFILKNVDSNSLDERYLLSSFESSIIPENVTKLADLYANKHETISFLDDSKKTRTASLLMVDINDINHSGHYNCFWDRHPIGMIKPIGCPVEYVFSQGIRDYVSEISKNRYLIRESLTKKSLERIMQAKSKDIGFISQDFYLTDGIFCSFNCCLAFIKENYRNHLYKNSEQLLYKLYFETFGKKIKLITPANHWRSLLIYGGDMTIDQFRNNLESVDYNFQGTMNLRPISHVYEKRYKL